MPPPPRAKALALWTLWGQLWVPRTQLTARAEDASEKTYVISCVGDSITYGEGDKKGFLSYPTVLNQLLGPKFQVNNYGKSGSTVVPSDWQYATRYESTYERALESGADLFVVQFGTNDAFPPRWNETQFRLSLNGFVDALQSLPQSPIVVLGVSPPYVYEDDKLGVPELHPVNFEVQRVTRDVADQRDLFVADHFELFGGFDNWNRAYYDIPDDGVHPNGAGYAAIGQNVYRTLSRVWDSEFGFALTYVPTYFPTTVPTLTPTRTREPTPRPTTPPTYAPSRVPAPAPTAAPVYAPTTLPSKKPSPAPTTTRPTTTRPTTASPTTTSPTSPTTTSPTTTSPTATAPTVLEETPSPTPAPAATPTSSSSSSQVPTSAQPTSAQPGSGMTYSPTSCPSVAPSAHTPSLETTKAPTTKAPTMNAATAVAGSMVVSGVDSASFGAAEARAFEAAFSPLAESIASVAVVSVRDRDRPRRRSLLEDDSEVDVAFSGSARDVASASGALSEAVDSGAFTASLRAASGTALESATAVSVTLSTTTTAPSPPSSSGPSSSSSSSGSGSSSSGDATTIYAAAGGAAVAFFLCAAAAVGVWWRRRRREAAKERKQRKRVADHDDGDEDESDGTADASNEPPKPADPRAVEIDVLATPTSTGDRLLLCPSRDASKSSTTDVEDDSAKKPHVVALERDDDDSRPRAGWLANVLSALSPRSDRSPKQWSRQSSCDIDDDDACDLDDIASRDDEDFGEVLLQTNDTPGHDEAELRLTGEQPKSKSLAINAAALQDDAATPNEPIYQSPQNKRTMSDAQRYSDKRLTKSFASEDYDDDHSLLDDGGGST